MTLSFSFYLLFLIIALILFAVAAWGWAPQRGNLMAAGLFFVALALIARG